MIKISPQLKTKILTLLVPIFYVVTLIFNGLAASGSLNGIATGDISAKYPVLFTPANYVFSIWSLIYLWLLAFTVFQLLPKQFKDQSLNKIRALFLLTSVLNSLWILVWQYEYLGISLFLMLSLLTTLIYLYQSEKNCLKKVSQLRKWLVQAPFSLYLGWISVATIANVSVVLFNANWNGFGLGDVFWTVLMMSVAVGLSLIMILRHQDYIFATVVVWSLIGIAVKNPDVQQIELTTNLGSVTIIGISAFWLVWSRGFFKQKT